MSTSHPDRLAAAREALAAAERTAAASSFSGSATPSDESGAPRSRASGPPSTQSGAETSSGSQRVADPYAVARQIVLRQLTMGPRSRGQLADKLRERGCEPDVAERVLNRMTEVGLVDDAAFARMLTHSKQQTKGLAAPAIRHELRTKGISDEVIEQTLADVDSEAEKDQARALVAKRLPRLHGLDRDVQVRRLAGFLGRKGYPAGVCYEVIREALDAAPEHQRD